MQTPCQITPLCCPSVPILPVPTEVLSDTGVPCPPAWPRQGCATSHVARPCPSPPEHLPGLWLQGTVGHHHPPTPSPSSCKGTQVGGERLNAPLQAQPCRKPVPSCPQGQRFGPWALLGHSGCAQRRRCCALLQQSAKAQEAAVGAGHPETGQAGRQAGPPCPPLH